MTVEAAAMRHFRVRARHEHGHGGRILLEPSFEAAALAYVEHLPLPAGGQGTVAVVVHELESGLEHSFTVHLGDDEVTPAGR